MGVFKNPGNRFLAPALDTVGVTDLRKYFIHQEMVMVPGSDVGENEFPRTMFNGVIKIPRGYSRNGVEDRLQVILQHRSGEATQTTRFCIECIYKDYS